MTAQGAGRKGTIPWRAAGVLALGAALVTPSAAFAQGSVGSQSPPALHYVLPNGLTVVLEEDHRQKVVALRISYAVGARDDPKDKLGLAHLVEHLTYRGSRHLADGQSMALLQQSGASDANGATSLDDTAYYATVSTGALDLALWLESERMAFTAERFDARGLLMEQRIVQEEESLRANGPVALFRVLFDSIFGREHPYGSTPGRGSWVSDLTLDDARSFFLAGYRPDNARLVLVGDFETAAARALVARYFGSIRNPVAPHVRARPPVTPIAREGHHILMRRGASVDEVAMGWQCALSNLRDLARAELLLRFASADLERRAVNETRALTSLKIRIESLELGSLCVAEGRLSPGTEPGEVPVKISDEFSRMGQQVPALELERVRHQALTEWLTRWENLGQRAALQEYMLRFLGRPIAANEYVHELEAVTAEDLRVLAGSYDPRLVTIVDAMSTYSRAPAGESSGAR